MKSIAIFLGAGAAKPFGCPITSEIFPLILGKIQSESLFDRNNGDRELLKSFLHKLLPGILKVDQLPMITDLLSLIDHFISRANTPLPGITYNEILLFRALLERAIIDVIDSPCYRFHFEKPPLLNTFAQYVLSHAPNKSIHLISTNYDTYLEAEIIDIIRSKDSIENKIDFGFRWRSVRTGNIIYSPTNPLISIYKLHGSMNWLKCDLCDHIYINTLGNIYHQSFRNDLDEHNSCHCGYGPLKSVIIAPSTERDIRDVNILNIWKNSIEALRKSDEWIIIGYSLPQEDLAIQSIFLRAYHGRVDKPKITIIQNGNDSKKRYQLFFKDFDYLDDGLEKYIARCCI
jgi:NAD-dependent SIR2 family protein deacetylase